LLIDFALCYLLSVIYYLSLFIALCSLLIGLQLFQFLTVFYAIPAVYEVCGGI